MFPIVHNKCSCWNDLESEQSVKTKKETQCAAIGTYLICYFIQCDQWSNLNYSYRLEQLSISNVDTHKKLGYTFCGLKQSDCYTWLICSYFSNRF